ncbi:hypothetical protein [Nocardioides daphniae]|uniref:Uncharacterized protein n=1 Tax=Nocardioides daphniae TaxID=402297 RepID=A0A4P7U9H3_9ACTN|nr:hypothetical protein [Nocardioides daphniae]QCC76251.1 hypothetical protein E2C04_01765 [Nocardioides daphniae]
MQIVDEHGYGVVVMRVRGVWNENCRESDLGSVLGQLGVAGEESPEVGRSVPLSGHFELMRAR